MTKFSSAILVALVPLFVPVAADIHAVRRRVIYLREPCRLLLEHSKYYGNTTTFKEGWTCFLSDNDATASGTVIVEIEGFNQQAFPDIESGSTTLFATGAILDNGKLKLPPDAQVTLGVAPRQGPAAQEREWASKAAAMTDSATASIVARAAQRRRVLAVRIVAADASTSASLNTMSDEIFGTFGDPVNLQERFRTCSYGQVLMEPYSGSTSTGATISSGVWELDARSLAVRGRNELDIVNLVLPTLNTALGSLETQFDHVMLCLPPGTTRGGTTNWAAYAKMNHWLSVYNDQYCISPQVQVHEIGHNLGLNHANEGTEEYGDDTGNMGNGSYTDDARMCYNPAKSWQLGWYQDKRLTLDFTSRGAFVGQLVGVDDYQDPNANGKYVNLQIVRPGSTDAWYVGFNLAAGINANTAEAQNMVTVTKQRGSDSSFLEAKLGAGGAVTYGSFLNGQTLTVRVTSIDLRAALPVANVEIYLGNRPSSPSPPTSPPVAAPAPTPQPPTTSCTTLTVQFRTDSWPEENRIVLKSSSSTTWNYGGFKSNTNYSVSTCVPNTGCTRLDVTDSDGDGLIDGGYIKVTYGSTVSVNTGDIKYGFYMNLGNQC